MHTYGIMAISLISSSRIPLFLFVVFIDAQSDSGPAVKSPLMEQIRIAKLKKLVNHVSNFYMANVENIAVGYGCQRDSYQ
jgi:hypothetical protein